MQSISSTSHHMHIYNGDNVKVLRTFKKSFSFYLLFYGYI